MYRPIMSATADIVSCCRHFDVYSTVQRALTIFDAVTLLVIYCYRRLRTLAIYSLWPRYKSRELSRPTCRPMLDNLLSLLGLYLNLPLLLHSIFNDFSLIVFD